VVSTVGLAAVVSRFMLRILQYGWMTQPSLNSATGVAGVRPRRGDEEEGDRRNAWVRVYSG
jgi:hypothetical protein